MGPMHNGRARAGRSCPPWAIGIWMVSAACSASPGAVTPVANQPQGGPCLRDTDCAPGLACHPAELDPTGAIWEGGNVCTIDCTQIACPSNNLCLATTDLPAPTAGSVGAGGPWCFRTCQSDSDCQVGQRAQACSKQRVADGGPGICEQLICDQDTACQAPDCVHDCPTGYACVAASGSKVYAWCEKL
jgi:hypothetical protein